jgi:O-antigen ligase
MSSRELLPPFPSSPKRGTDTGTTDTAGSQSKVSMVLRALPVAAVAAIAPDNPTLALRSGGVVCALILLCSLNLIRLRTADLYMTAYAGLIALSTYWTINEAATVLSMKNTFGGLLIFLAVRTVGANRIGWRLIAGGLVVGCCLVVYRIFTDNQVQDVRLSLDSTGTRYSLENINANYLAYVMATGMAIAFFLAVWLGRRRHFVILVGCLVMLYAGIIQSGTRGAFAGAVLALVWVAGTRLIKPNSTVPLRVLLLGLAAIALSIVTGLFQSIAQTYISRSVRERGDLNGRFLVWPAGKDWWWQHFWFGSGAGTFPEVNTLHIAAHNFVLDIGTGVGVAGVTLFSAVLYKSLWKDTSELPSRVLLVGAYSLVSAPLLLSGFWIESPVFWLGLALVGVLGRSWRVPDSVPVDVATPEHAHRYRSNSTQRLGRP